MAETKVINLEVKSNVGDLNKDLKTTTQSVNDLTNATAEAGNKSKVFADIKNVVTSMVPGLKAAEGGVNSFSSSLKALIANPVIMVITGIVAALKFVYEAFQSNVKIGKEIATVWAGIKAVGSQITDAIMGMTRSFGYAAQAAYKFITLDFKGASESIKKANEEAATSYDQLTKAVNGTTFSIIKNLEKQQQANNKAKKEQAVRQSEINKLLVQSREILTDETESIQAKKKALDEVTKAESESSKEKVRTAKVDLDILVAKSKALGGQAEVKMKQEIREATIALNEAEMENAMTGIKLNKQRKMLLRQENEERKAAIEKEKELAKIRKEAQEKNLEDNYKRYLKEKEARENLIKEEQYWNDKAKAIDDAEALRKKQIQDQQIADEQMLSAFKIETWEYEAKRQLEIDQKAAEDKKKLQQQKIDAVQNGLTTIANLSELFANGSRAQQEKAFKIQKAANIANATIDTYKAATGAYASLSSVPVVGPVLGAAAAGAAITAGLLNVKKIASQQFGGGGEQSSSSGGGSAPTTTQSGGIAPTFNIVGNNGTNQLKQLQQAPVQAYVVSGEMSTQQALDRNRLRNATL